MSGESPQFTQVYAYVNMSLGVLWQLSVHHLIQAAKDAKWGCWGIINNSRKMDVFFPVSTEAQNEGRLRVKVPHTHLSLALSNSLIEWPQK